MGSLLLELFLRVLVGGVLLSLAVISWQGSSLAYASGNLERSSVGRRVILCVGWFLTALSVLWLFISIGLGIVISSSQFNAWTPWLATTGVAVLALCSTAVAVLSRRRIAEHLQALLDEQGPADDQPTGWQSRHVWWRSPLGNVGLLLGVSILLALFWFIALTAEIDDRDDAASIGITALAIGGEFLLLLGMGLVTAVTVASLPEQTLMPQERRTLSQILVLSAVLFLILGAIALAWFGVIAVITGLVLLLSTLGGRRRATQLGVFWTLTNAVRSGRSSEAELREQAAAATGRTRWLLLGVVQRLEQGANWCQALCRREVVPESAWLELHGALESDSLPAALEEAVARETRRFSQQGDPNTPRLALGYFGLVGTVMLLGFAFIGYWIVPKLRKIFEDFEVEVPEITQSVFNASGSNTTTLLLLGGTMMFLLMGTLGEMLVDFYGWHGVLDMLPGFWHRRRRAPDLLSLAQRT